MARGNRVVIRAPLAALLLAFSFVAAAQTAIAPFPVPAPSELPAPWHLQPLPRAAASDIRLVGDNGSTVLQARASNSAGAAVHPLAAPAQGTLLAWRWKIDHPVASADMDARNGDDFAARVYVFFDVPVEAIPLAQRVKIVLARLLYGAELPTAAICYVWDNRHAPGTSRWSPYTDRVRVVVLRSGSADAGAWKEESRDLAADFIAAFGSQWKRPVPAITGIALGNDTDQTGESATAWFADVRLERRR
jgi:hypothetical protein